MIKLELLLVIAAGFFALQSCQNTGQTGTQEEPAAAVLDTSAYLRLGDELTMQTFDTLSTALKKQIAEAGPAQAIEYCRLEAYPITAVHADEGVLIRRTSLKYRNPENRPDSLETARLTDLQQQIGQGQSPQTQVLRMPDGSVHYFKPILLQPLCLNCHGKPGEDIQAETMAAIQAAYPDDRAVGYAAGELRGAWHVVFEAE